MKSEPEAANFPNQQYDFSSESTLFSPPSKYPDAPRDMYYQVPERTGPSPPPKPIFPWEAHAPKATRVFPTYKAPSPPPIMETVPAAATAASEPPQESSHQSEDAPWNSFTRGNAWDEVPEIERYVQAVNQARKGKIQVLHHTPSGTASEPLTSPPIAEDGRRPSMKLTDFPTEIERPSLPVTPAPIRRPSFWGEERDELGELPAAEGVPKQSDWVRSAILRMLLFQLLVSSILIISILEPRRQARGTPTTAVRGPGEWTTGAGGKGSPQERYA
jgi:glycogenin glucosyltransferase